MRYITLISYFILFYSHITYAENNLEPQNYNNQAIFSSIDSRLNNIEKVINNNSLLGILDSVEFLKLEVAKLRGEVESYNNEVEQLKQRQRELYTDVNDRLQALELGKKKNVDKTVKTLSEEIEQKTGVSLTRDINIEETTETTEEIEKDDIAKIEIEYQRAFKLLKKSLYDRALTAFKDFLERYPNSPFSDNAQYWLGEINYVMQNYDFAINEYQALLNTYPDSLKVSAAMLKIGYSYAELGNIIEAKKTLNNLMEKYPETASARLADNYLMNLGNASNN